MSGRYEVSIKNNLSPTTAKKSEETVITIKRKIDIEI